MHRSDIETALICAGAAESLWSAQRVYECAVPESVSVPFRLAQRAQALLRGVDAPAALPDVPSFSRRSSTSELDSGASMQGQSCVDARTGAVLRVVWSAAHAATFLLFPQQRLVAVQTHVHTGLGTDMRQVELWADESLLLSDPSAAFFRHWRTGDTLCWCALRHAATGAGSREYALYSLSVPPQFILVKDAATQAPVSLDIAPILRHAHALHQQLPATRSPSVSPDSACVGWDGDHVVQAEGVATFHISHSGYVRGALFVDSCLD